MYVLLTITDRCNLRCHYCYTVKRIKRMSYRTAWQSVRYIAENYPDWMLGFFGGEPLLEWSFMQKIIKYAEKLGIRKFGFPTNGLLLNKKILEYCIEHNVTFSLSTDGCKEAQDFARETISGKGSFNILDKKMDIIREYLPQFRQALEIRLTYTPNTVPYLNKSVDYLISKGLYNNTRIALVPVVSCYKWGKKDFQILQLELEKIILSNKIKGLDLNIVMNECLNLNNQFKNINSNGKGEFCGVGGTKKLAISIDGLIYPCHILGATWIFSKELQKKVCLGSIWTGITEKKRSKWIQENHYNPYASCLAWNYLTTGNPKLPHLAYRGIYKAWLRATKYYSNSNRSDF